MANDDKTPPNGSPDQQPETEQARDSGRSEKSESRSSRQGAEQSGKDTGQSGKSGNAHREKAPTSGRDKPVVRRRRWWIPVTLVLLLLLGASAGGLYWGWLHWQDERAAWAEQQQALEQNISSLEERLSRVASAQSDRDETIDSLRSGLEQSESRLMELASQLDREMAVQSSDIQRLEIEYLLRNARHVSLLNQDISQAEQLLQQADRQLAELENLAYLPVREALAIDIQVLRELPRPDVDGLYFELQALANRAPEWTWWPETADPAENEEESDPVINSAWLASVWSDLRQLVTVRYRSDTSSERLGPAAFQQMQTQFQLFIQQAQVALIQRNERLFQASLDQAADWLERGMDQVPESRQLVNRLSRLANTRIELEIPRIDRGLQALQQMDEPDDTAEEETAE